MVVRELTTILVFFPAGIFSVSQNKENFNEDQVGIKFYLPVLLHHSIELVSRFNWESYS